jgi:uncharacterized protein (DUF1778 family)
VLTYGKLPYIIVINSPYEISVLFAMATTTNQKSMARLETRISPETKALLQKAADLEGRTLTDFVVATVLAEAYRVIEKHQTLKLNIDDSEAFINALLNPPKPNEALKVAALRYKEEIQI